MSKADKAAQKAKAMSSDIRDIKERAQQFISKKPCDKIKITHQN